MLFENILCFDVFLLFSSTLSKIQLGCYSKTIFIKIYYNSFSDPEYTKQFNGIKETKECMVDLLKTLQKRQNKSIFQYEGKVSFLCPYFAADNVPPYPK